MNRLKHYQNSWCKLYVTIDWLRYCLVALIHVFNMVLMYQIAMLCLCQPYVIRKILSSHEIKKLAAMQAKYDVIIKKGTCSLCDFLGAKKAIGTK